ncbi:MAG: beta strand repeat-containing protein [Roseiarcus sp.]
MTTDYTAQINALSQAIQFQPASASDISNFNAGLNSGSLTLAGVQSLLELEPYTTNYVNPVIREYQAAFGRVPDQAGLKFWVGAIAANSSALSTLGTTFANSAEFNTKYGATATTVASVALVGELYANVLGRPGDSAGITFWASSGLNAAQLLTAFAQSPEFITDTTTAVTNYENLEAAGTPATTGSLFSLAPPPAGQTFTLTTGVDNINSTGANDIVVGTLALSGATLNAGDQIAMNGGTLKIVDTNTTPNTNELAGVNITGPFKFNVQDIAAPEGYDFLAASGITAVQSTNSLMTVSFTNLAAGASVTASGSGTTATLLNFSMASASSAVTVGFDSGVNGLTIADNGTSPVPTALTINSTGAANGTAAKPDVVNLQETVGKLTSVTINAATNLVAGFDSSTQSLTTAAADFAAAGAALKVSGIATSVDLTRGNQGVYSTIDASGLTNGGLTVASDSVLTSFKGGAGNNTLLGTAISASATSINGGAGVNTLGAGLVTLSNAAIFSNWQNLDITSLNAAGVATVDAKLLTADTGGISGVVTNSTDSGSVNAKILDLNSAATLTLGGQGVTDTAITLSHLSGTVNTLAVTFADASASAGNNILTTLTSTGDATVSIASGGSASGTTNAITTYNETDNNPTATAITITGANNFTLGGVHTDTSALGTLASGNTVASSLTSINASGVTGAAGVTITAGLTDVGGLGGTITYTGLTITGSSGGVDNIENDALNGTITLGNGGTALTAGNITSATVTNTGATVNFGTGYDNATITAAHYAGVAGSTAQAVTVNGAISNSHDTINVHSFQTTLTTVTDYSTSSLVTAAGLSLASAEGNVANAIGSNNVGYFVSGTNEYIVATGATAFSGAAVNSYSTTVNDVVITVTGGAFHHITDVGGVLTLA